MKKHLQSKIDLSRTIGELFLDDCNERTNQYFLKYRNCYIDFDEYRDIVCNVLESFYDKMDKSFDPKYLERKYIFTAFRNASFANLDKIKINANYRLKEYSDYLDFDLLLDNSVLIDQESFELLPAINAVAELAKLSEPELAILIDSAYHRKNYGQIAEYYSISSGTVQNRLRSAKSKIRSVLVITPSG